MDNLTWYINLNNQKKSVLGLDPKLGVIGVQCDFANSSGRRAKEVMVAHSFNNKPVYYRENTNRYNANKEELNCYWEVEGEYSKTILGWFPEILVNFDEDGRARLVHDLKFGKGKRFNCVRIISISPVENNTDFNNITIDFIEHRHDGVRKILCKSVDGYREAIVKDDISRTMLLALYYGTCGGKYVWDK